MPLFDRCPVEVKMMKEVRRVDGGGRKALESYLEAFSFTGSNLLSIETEVETCINSCKPVSIKFCIISLLTST